MHGLKGVDFRHEKGGQPGEVGVSFSFLEVEILIGR